MSEKVYRKLVFGKLARKTYPIPLASFLSHLGKLQLVTICNFPGRTWKVVRKSCKWLPIVTFPNGSKNLQTVLDNFSVQVFGRQVFCILFLMSGHSLELPMGHT